MIGWSGSLTNMARGHPTLNIFISLCYCVSVFHCVTWLLNLSPWHMTRHDGPSRRVVWQGCRKLLKIKNKHCSVMLFRLTDRQDGSCDTGAVATAIYDGLERQRPSWRPSRLVVSGALNRVTEKARLYCTSISLDNDIPADRPWTA